MHSEIEKLVITLLVMRSFSVLLGAPRACLDFREPTAVFRFIGVDLVAGGQTHGVLLGRGFLEDVIMIYGGLKAQVTHTGQKERGNKFIVLHDRRTRRQP